MRIDLVSTSTILLHVRVVPKIQPVSCYIPKIQISCFFNPRRALLSRNFDARENFLLIRNRSRSPDTWNPPSNLELKGPLVQQESLSCRCVVMVFYPVLINQATRFYLFLMNRSLRVRVSKKKNCTSKHSTTENLLRPGDYNVEFIYFQTFRYLVINSIANNIYSRKTMVRYI